MRVVLFGATGMVGSAALLECLEEPDVTEVLSIGRRSCAVEHDKLSELVHEDLFDYASVTDRLSGFDACFFCLGVSSVGMSEEEYTRITHDLTVAVAEALLEASPSPTFCFISGAGADSSEKGRVMWARVKGKIENRLLAMPFKHVWVFRPAVIQPMKGIRSRSTATNAFYAVIGPLRPFLPRLVPSLVTTTETIGKAMIRAAQDGAPVPILESREINQLVQ